MQPPPAPASVVLREKLDAAERLVRHLTDACFAAWAGIHSSHANGSTRAAKVLMDCSYVASTTARLLAHAEEYQLHMLAMQVAVCRRVARQCAQVCDDHRSSPMTACARSANIAALACSELLGLLWDGRIGPIPDADEAPIAEGTPPARAASEN